MQYEIASSKRNASKRASSSTDDEFLVQEAKKHKNSDFFWQ